MTKLQLVLVLMQGRRKRYQHYTRFAFTLQLKLNTGSRLSSKQPPITELRNITQLRNSHYLLAQIIMASLDSTVSLTTNKQLDSSCLALSEKYSFKVKRLTRLMDHLLVNVTKYFKSETKKQKAIPKLLRKHTKQWVR